MHIFPVPISISLFLASQATHLLIQDSMHQSTARPHKPQINRLFLVQEHGRDEREVVRIQQPCHSCICAHPSVSDSPRSTAAAHGPEEMTYGLAVGPSAPSTARREAARRSPASAAVAESRPVPSRVCGSSSGARVESCPSPSVSSRKRHVRIGSVR